MTMPRKHRFAADGFQYLFDRHVGDDPRRRIQWEKAGANQDIALMIYALRTHAGLTQAALAKRIGTATSVISRLEDADYEGHSLAMLRRIAGALGKRVEIRLVEDKPRATQRKRRHGKSAA